MGHYYNYKFNKLFMLLIAWLCSIGAFAIDNVTFDAKDGNIYNFSNYLGKTINVILTNRTFTEGQFAGICLPFDASSSVLTSAFPNGYELYELTTATESSLSFSLKEEQSIAAGVPYLIKSLSTVSGSITFPGVTINQSVLSDNFIVHEKTKDANLQFTGHYFFKWGYLMTGGLNSSTRYYLSGDGTNLSSDWRNENYGTEADIYSSSSSPKPSLIIGNSGESGQGGES